MSGVRFRAGFLALGIVACGDGDPSPDADYAATVVDYRPGPGAGFGQDHLPAVVLGPPAGLGRTAGSLDVLSLGMGGEIDLGFTDPIVDGPGPDFVVFENPFYPDNDPSRVFAELGEVFVSPDGIDWWEFECDPAPSNGPWPGCAGWRPTLMYDPATVRPLDPAQTGGDPFDLADVGLSEVRFIRIRDRTMDATAPTAGFDLDAVGVIRR